MLDQHKKIYLSQFTAINANRYMYFPYSVGSIWAYAESKKTVSRNNLGKIFFLKEDLKSIITQINNPYIFAFSNYIWNSKFNDSLAKKIKKKWPKCIIIYGGADIPNDITSPWFASHTFVDICVHQEGEIVFDQILNSIPLEKINGISYQKKGIWIKTSSSQRINKLEELASPYLLGLFDNLLTITNKTYQDFYINALLETDRGCPYQCTFCDWGGTTFSKIKKFNLDKIFQEIEWVGKNKIQMLSLANANFGIFKDRDELIVDKIIETKNTYGFPKEFETSWAKNSNLKIFNLVSKLNSAKISQPLRISIQSLNPNVLKNIKRENLETNNFQELVKIANKDNIFVLVELIMGLPGESFASWTNNFAHLIEHDNISINIYPCSLLKNSELNSFDTIKKFKIKYIDKELLFKDNKDYIEHEKLIIETSSMPYNNMLKSWEWSWCTQLGHFMGFTYDILNDLKKNYSVSTKFFYDNWYDYIKNSEGILNQNFKKWRKHLLEYNIKHYMYRYDYIDSLGNTSRIKTIEDISNFLKKTFTYIKDTDKYEKLFDYYHYSVKYEYPRKFDNVIITNDHFNGTLDYCSFIGFARKNRNWRCNVQTQ